MAVLIESRSLAVAVVPLLAIGLACDAGHERAGPPAAAAAAATWVGRRACAECHAKEVERYSGSDHDRAMEIASPSTVLGDFSGAIFRYGATRSTFSVSDGRFRARTDGSDGRLADFDVAYTFGVRPLQQYLVPAPGGRLQALPIAWDSRPAERGGSRWFHLHSESVVDFRDVLHWTGAAQNWNSMCAECHSTNLRKRYDPEADRYDTTFVEIDVSCEACHGPASNHLVWARQAKGGTRAGDPAMGLVVSLRDRSGGGWELAPGERVARRTRPPDNSSLLDVCGKCHARRAQIAEDEPFEAPLAESFRVSLLDEGLYEADGQIEDEVYEYGSFLQSRMHAKGVRCVDCHDPHTARLAIDGNGLCATCHRSEAYDTPEHHHHAAGSAGSRCVDCHMATRRYMGIDDRRDHSFRVPRPDLSVAIGVSNACNDCHTRRTPEWAAGTVARWIGPGRTPPPHWAEAIHAGRRWRADAPSRLAALVEDGGAPAIARATAVTLLGRFPGPLAARAVDAASRNTDPLIRRASAETLQALPPELALRAGAALLDDPVRTVRLEAAAAMASVPLDTLPAASRGALDRAIGELRQAHRFNADRASGWSNLGNLEAALGRAEEAERALRTAIVREPYFAPASINLADLYRGQGRESDAEHVLRALIEREAGIASAHHALGLCLVRQGRRADAVRELRRAVELDPEDPRFAYVLGVALLESDTRRDGERLLRRAFERFPGFAPLAEAVAGLGSGVD